MEWYEHLLGILAVFTCINWIIIMAVIRVGAQADERCAGSCVSPAHVEKRPDVTLGKYLDKVTGLPLLQRRYQRALDAESNMPAQPATQSAGIITSSQKLN